MFRYGILLAKKPLGYVQYNLLRNRSKRSISELKQAIIQRDILELWETEASKEDYQSYMLLIGYDLKIWHNAGIHFQIFRIHSDSDWREVADFSAANADGLSRWQQESDRTLRLEAALKNILAGQRGPNDLKLMSGVIDESLPVDLATTTQLLSEAFPFQSVDERGKLTALLQDEELRRFFTKKAGSEDGRADADKAGHTKHAKTKQSAWSGFLRLFGRSG